MQNTRSGVATLALSIILTGCGQSTTESETLSDEPTNTTAPAPRESTASTATQSAASEQSISVSDIDRWQRGMEAERKATQDAAAKLAEAKDENAKLDALNAATEMGTLDVGAAAAGVDADRYRRIRNILSDAVSNLSPLELEMDVSQMPAEMVEQMKQARSASAAQVKDRLPADVLEALEPRVTELRTLQKELVAERLKAAQAAR